MAYIVCSECAYYDALVKEKIVKTEDGEEKRVLEFPPICKHLERDVESYRNYSMGNFVGNCF